MQGMTFIRVFVFYWCSLVINRKWQETFKNTVDLSPIYIYEQLQVANLLRPKKSYDSNQETPMDSAVICYSSGSFVGSILRKICLAGGRCGFHLVFKYFARCKKLMLKLLSLVRWYLDNHIAVNHWNKHIITFSSFICAIWSIFIYWKLCLMINVEW